MSGSAAITIGSGTEFVDMWVFAVEVIRRAGTGAFPMPWTRCWPVTGQDHRRAGAAAAGSGLRLRRHRLRPRHAERAAGAPAKRRRPAGRAAGLLCLSPRPAADGGYELPAEPARPRLALTRRSGKFTGVAERWRQSRPWRLPAGCGGQRRRTCSPELSTPWMNLVAPAVILARPHLRAASTSAWCRCVLLARAERAGAGW